MLKCLLYADFAMACWDPDRIRRTSWKSIQALGRCPRRAVNICLRRQIFSWHMALSSTGHLKIIQNAIHFADLVNLVLILLLPLPPCKNQSIVVGQVEEQDLSIR